MKRGTSRTILWLKLGEYWYILWGLPFLFVLDSSEGVKAEFKDEKPVTSRKGISRSSLLSSFRKELVLIQPRVSLIYAVKLRFDLNILFHFGCSGGIYFYFSVRAVQLSRKKILDLKSYLVKFEASGKTANKSSLCVVVVYHWLCILLV